MIDSLILSLFDAFYLLGLCSVNVTANCERKRDFDVKEVAMTYPKALLLHLLEETQEARDTCHDSPSPGRELNQ
jgi:hypothetical protein